MSDRGVGYRWEWPIWQRTYWLRKRAINPDVLGAQTRRAFLYAVLGTVLAFFAGVAVDANRHGNPIYWHHGLTTAGTVEALAFLPLAFSLLWFLLVWVTPALLLLAWNAMWAIPRWLLLFIPRRRLHLMPEGEADRELTRTVEDYLEEDA